MNSNELHVWWQVLASTQRTIPHKKEHWALSTIARSVKIRKILIFRTMMPRSFSFIVGGDKLNLFSLARLRRYVKREEIKFYVKRIRMARHFRAGHLAEDNKANDYR